MKILRKRGCSQSEAAVYCVGSHSTLNFPFVYWRVACAAQRSVCTFTATRKYWALELSPRNEHISITLDILHISKHVRFGCVIFDPAKKLRNHISGQVNQIQSAGKYFIMDAIFSVVVFSNYSALKLSNIIWSSWRECSLKVASSGVSISWGPSVADFDETVFKWRWFFSTTQIIFYTYMYQFPQEPTWYFLCSMHRNFGTAGMSAVNFQGHQPVWSAAPF